MRYITVTWDDIEWINDDENEPYDTHIGGFVIDEFRFVQTDDMSRDELVELHNNAKRDLDEMIECEHCSAFLSEINGEWFDKNNSQIGINQWDGINQHIHKPERLWFHILVDILEQYGAWQDNIGSWYSGYSTVDYKNGIDREYAVHIDWDIQNWEYDLIYAEIKRRADERQEWYDKYLKRS